MREHSDDLCSLVTVQRPALQFALLHRWPLRLWLQPSPRCQSFWVPIGKCNAPALDLIGIAALVVTSYERFFRTFQTQLSQRGRVRQSGASTKPTQPVQRQHRLLVSRFDGYKPHAWALGRISDCGRVRSVVLVRFDERAHELGGNESDFMPERRQLPGRSGTGSPRSTSSGDSSRLRRRRTSASRRP